MAKKQKLTESVGGMKSSIKGGSKDSKSGGFSIIEVLVASSLLVIGVSAVFMACITTMKTQYAANNLYHATCLARNRIQRGLALPFNTLPVLEDSDIHIDQDGHATTEGKFIRSTELKKLSDNAYEIKVKIFFPINNDKMSAVPATITSMISRGMHNEDL